MVTTALLRISNLDAKRMKPDGRISQQVGIRNFGSQGAAQLPMYPQLPMCRMTRAARNLAGEAAE